MRVAMLGAGGHGVALLSLLRHNGFTDVAVYDDNYREGMRCADRLVCGTRQDIPQGMPVVIAVGEPSVRQKLYRELDTILQVNLIHPSAIIEEGAQLGVANQIAAHAYINTQARLGDNILVNTGAIIEHEAEVGSHSHISVRASICGQTSIGRACMIGAGSTVIDELDVADGVTLGAGSVAVRSLTHAGVYLGVPARPV